HERASVGVDAATKEAPRLRDHSDPLPPGKAQRAVVLLSGAMLREETAEMTRIDVTTFVLPPSRTVLPTAAVGKHRTRSALAAATMAGYLASSEMRNRCVRSSCEMWPSPRYRRRSSA